MTEILTRRLVGKSIVGTDGTVFGTLSTITMDPESGALCDLVVEPRGDGRSKRNKPLDDEGRMHIPFGRIETVRDQIVVQVGN
ncbi:PRC-barrel domain-containing protein [Haloterrigena alkaliphila]|uniref:PRC-barrel domain-containing protein n=1 Tax=Haloterrigena alkaliphila TaxID=2816475 RepID=A0A8A2VGQ2_9EURY|nr:PRC-barrel domain-containing protein [Haloterrigena alkaliphila]QSW99860.1 PRC-barrel domain-containing protein [Haloterrigena alkaliphila]